MNNVMLQRAEELLGANVRVEDAKKGGMLRILVYNKDGDEILASPPLSMPRLEAFLFGVLAGYQAARRIPATVGAPA